MYSLRQLSVGLRNPSRVAEEINKQFASHILTKLRPPTAVFEEDWDNLILLDGCRHDLLEPEDFSDATVESRCSGGSHSIEFLEYNVAGTTLDDVVWITANPWVSRFTENVFDVRNVWETGWNDEYRTVLPETMADRARNVGEQFPHKRLVIHFMQPHYPFIGEIGRTELPDHRPFTGDGMILDEEEVGSDIWDLLRDGHVQRDSVWRAYRENYELVLPHANGLAEDLSGRSVISSDHGNEFGGRCFPIPYKLYGHPMEYRTRNLVKVPWVVFESDERKQIEDGKISKSYNPSGSIPHEKLEALGYIKEDE